MTKRQKLLKELPKLSILEREAIVKHLYAALLALNNAEAVLCLNNDFDSEVYLSLQDEDYLTPWAQLYAIRQIFKQEGPG